MNAERLLELYDRISEAPDAISRLRRFILDLAVRGKLVEQHPEDQPASELLERIATEKTRLVKAGEIRQNKTPPKLNDGATPFTLPHGWTWSRINELGVISPRNDAPDEYQASFVPMPMIPSEYGVTNQHEPRAWGEIKKGYTHFAEGDVGLAKITPCFENGKSTVFRNLVGGMGAGTTELHIVRPLFVTADYILLFLKSPHFIETGISQMTGTAGQKRVPKEYFTDSPFPLPPPAEQHRIVAKVDKLMALCDRLEATRNTRETTRDKLTTASLSRLTAADIDEQTFHSHARFALDTFPALTTRPEKIKTLRQIVLDLAVNGQLTESHSAETSALDYLKALPDTPKRTQGMLKSLDSDQIGQMLPADWAWLPLGALISGMDAGWSPQCKDERRNSEQQWAVLKTTAAQALEFQSSENKRLPDSLSPRPEHVAQVGDILVTRAGPKQRVGVSCVVDVECPRLMISDKLIRFHVIGELSPWYVALALNAGYSSFFIEEAKSGMAVMQMNISQAKLKAIPIPVPPLAEQHRIVAKVNELMALCDQLEASLTRAETTRSRLLEAALHKALQAAAEVLEPA